MSGNQDLKKMIEDQIIKRGGINNNVLNVMQKVDRSKFVFEADAEAAFEDRPLPIGFRQTISQPYMVALMTSELAVKSTDCVLEIGTGSGYQTAILAELADHVFTIERIDSLGEAAKNRLFKLRYTNVDFHIGDGTLGWADQSPFDKIMVTAASPKIPRTLTDQLKTGGIMVIPVGYRSTQELKVAEKRIDGSLKVRNKGKCIFVPLLGEEGYHLDG